MCGICGILNLDGKQVSEKLLRKMAKTLVHRGPDDHGDYIDGNLGLAHRRLSIIDLTSGHQPMSNENGEIRIAFNGEIFNHQSLRDSMLQRGHRFKTQCDTEAIIHSYEEYGHGVLDHLRGQFAFALWDRNKKNLFLARDRIGIKPLYYAQRGKAFYFASEINAILSVIGESPTLDTQGLNQYLTLGYTWGNTTLFSGIHKLEPGHFVSLDTRNFETGCYWRVEDYIGKYHRTDSQTCTSAVTSLVEDAVTMRMMSDVPLGAFLSGGVDSSIVVSIMAEASRSAINTFSVVFEDEKFDESPFSSMVARKYGTNHRTLNGEYRTNEILPTIIRHLEEPIPDCATIPTYAMSKLTKDFVTVVLSGDGADEVFAGYNKYSILLSMYYASPMRIFTSPFVNYFYKKKLNGRRGISLSTDMRDLYVALLSAFNQTERSGILNRDFLEVENELISSVPTHIHPLDTLQCMDLKYWLPNDVLLKVDKMGMAAGLETRLPYLDHKVIETALCIKPKLRMSIGKQKKILKQQFAHKLPPEVISRRKQGFNFPFESVVSNDVITSTFGDSSLYSFLDRDQVMKIVERRNSPEAYGNKFRNLFFLFYWHRLYIEEQSE
ncbi:MAG: asparagine synthase (glutamine-hydrolyzing) [Chitinispirillaceae bacterium]